MTFEQKIRQYIREKQLMLPAGKVLVALSGGADSVALLLTLARLGYKCEAIHCNFHLRGTESMRDEQFVKQLCRRESITLHHTDLYAAEYAQSHHISIEMAARQQRYTYFEEIREQTDARVIAVAHHRDDSVETFLLNLIRGTGVNGLQGIRPRNGKVVRPLLCVSRAEILNYLQENQQNYVTDSTNLQDEYTRNKIRLNILPMLREINPSVSESIYKTASRLEQVSKVYRQTIENEKVKIIRQKDDKTFCIDIPELLAQPSPECLLFEVLYPLGFNSEQIEAILQNLTAESGHLFGSSKYRLLKDRNNLIVQENDISEAENPSAFELPNEGEISCFGLQIQVCRQELTSDFCIPQDKNTACLDADKLKSPLTIRKVQTGDFFHPFGMKGKKLLSNFMTDLKFSIFEKEQQCVICSGKDIIWVVGQRIDNRYRIDDSTRSTILLTIR